jgi:hypothetical protein
MIVFADDTAIFFPDLSVAVIVLSAWNRYPTELLKFIEDSNQLCQIAMYIFH